MSKPVKALTCPCDDARRYADCCEPFHHGTPAPTAEALMRSRYSAYALRLEPYLLASWHAEQRPQSLDLDTGTRWLRLKVLRHEPQGDHAQVEFIATYRTGGASAQKLHELSRFRREQGRWYYVDGDIKP